MTDRTDSPADAQAPIPMVLYCPNCGMQHIDAPDPDIPGQVFRDGRFVKVPCVVKANDPAAWTNPPHRSHLCAACGCIWRPADVPTTGVASITTRGKADTWPVYAGEISAQPADAQAEPLTDAQIDALAQSKCDNFGFLYPHEIRSFARAVLAAAAQPQQPAPLAQEPAAALVRARNVSTRAEIAFDGKDHFSEWGEWYPTTYKHAKAVTDPSRNSDPVLYEMRPLYTMATSGAQKG